MKKTISEIESIIEDRIAELEEEYELDIFDRNDIREEEYRKGGWKHDPFPEELEEEEDYFPDFDEIYDPPKEAADLLPPGPRLSVQASFVSPTASQLFGQAGRQF